MKPSEIYVLPDLEASAWHDCGDRVLEEAFGLDLYGQLDHGRAESEGDARIMVHQKLRCSFDFGERTAGVYALTFDGAPFGIYRAAGRGQSDFREFVATDRNLYAAALEHLRTYQVGVPDLDFVDPDSELEGLSSFYGARILAHGADVLLVRDEMMSLDGRLLFDTRRYDEAFDRIVRKSPGALQKGLGSPDVLPLFARALAEGVPPELDPVVVAAEGTDGDWIGAVMSTGEGTYAVGLASYDRRGVGFSSASSVSCARIGGPEAIESYREALPVPPGPR